MFRQEAPQAIRIARFGSGAVHGRMSLWMLLLCALLLSGCRATPSSGPTVEEATKRELRTLSLFAFGECVVKPGDPFRLPEGTRKDLEGWLERKREYFSEQGRLEQFYLELGVATRLIGTGASGGVSLKDGWGNFVVYECPAKDPQYLWRLYSMGPNGVDEGVSGDDIDGSLRYERVAGYFEDQGFDGDAYRAKKDRLVIVRVPGGLQIRTRKVSKPPKVMLQDRDRQTEHATKE